MSYNEASKQPARAEASGSFPTSALIPSRWTGFIAAVSLTATHLTVVGIVTISFPRSTSHSLLGNHWQAVSQVVSEETRTILEQADIIRDKDVKRWAKSQSVDMGSHAVLRYRRNGRISLSTHSLPHRTLGQTGSRERMTLRNLYLLAARTQQLKWTEVTRMAQKTSLGLVELVGVETRSQHLLDIYSAYPRFYRHIWFRYPAVLFPSHSTACGFIDETSLWH